MDSENNFSQTAPHVFNGENYQLSKLRMKTYPETLDLWETLQKDYDFLVLHNKPMVAQITSQKEKEIKKSTAKATLFASVCNNFHEL